MPCSSWLPPYPNTSTKLATLLGGGGCLWGLIRGGGLLNKFSKALRPTGMECSDNSWPFWSVTSFGSCSGGRGRKCFNGSGLRIWTLLFWLLFNYLQINGLIGVVVMRDEMREKDTRSFWCSTLFLVLDPHFYFKRNCFKRCFFGAAF